MTKEEERDMCEFPIDFVITWVDGSDEAWLADKEKYEDKVGDNRNSRYRDWDILRYLFRSIESYAGWVNKIFFVTCGHLPEWLNTENPKLVIVKHEDYIPKEFLPTFSSRTIDMNLHRIPGLSEHFVYFNDDMILLQNVSRSDFFRNGLPCDTAVLRPAIVSIRNSFQKTRTSQLYLSPVIDMSMINKYFNKHKVIMKNLTKWYNPIYGMESLKTLSMGVWKFFPGIRNYHCSYSYLKQTYIDLWNLEEEAFNEVCSHRFRVNTDYNHLVFSYWQMAKGKFAPRNPKFGVACGLNNDEGNNKKIFTALQKRKFKVLCINDNVSDENFDTTKEKLKGCLENIFNKKSSFEI